MGGGLNGKGNVQLGRMAERKHIVQPGRMGKGTHSAGELGQRIYITGAEREVNFFIFERGPIQNDFTLKIQCIIILDPNLVRCE